MRARFWPFAAPLVAGFVAAACATTEAPSRPETPRTLRSERRLQFLVAAAAPTTSQPEGAAGDLRAAVADEMAGLGLPVVRDAHQAYDVEVRVAAASPGGAMMMWALRDDGRVLDQWSAAPGAPRGPAHDLVEKLAGSERVSGYADSLYGRRLRPLRDTIGRHAYVPGDRGGTPPLESMGRAQDGD